MWVPMFFRSLRRLQTPTSIQVACGSVEVAAACARVLLTTRSYRSRFNSKLAIVYPIHNFQIPPIPAIPSRFKRAPSIVMENLVRLAKPGNGWSSNELIAYNISIVERDQNTFFNGDLPVYTGPASFVQYRLDASSLALIKRLNLAMVVMEDEDSAVDDFTAMLLRVLGYETEQTVIYTQKNIRLSICGEEVYTKTDVCVMDVNYELLLLAQEDKSHIKLADPEPQLVAEVIAAFQANNSNRVFPGITMVGTFPRFYKIEVTADLDITREVRLANAKSWKSSSLQIGIAFSRLQLKYRSIVLQKAMNIAKTFAYARYSKFLVGAAILTQDREIITGCSVENASYEHTAILKAVGEGKLKFAALDVTTFAVKTLCKNNVDGVKESTLGELLRCNFGPEDLEKD
ncbi:hypothetical protein K503DRAFT_785802 [Rhizopogon vinicolor AM-OR11-026]|uniref:Uncharacterized protein n=1 Tax=Rhizopogon vinicolor AM-OR11-026 TaxID=1314800 RepID=A0A1B7MP50_9AGAM|nr:hypothetical protein K503DRAFT_785802 [Rhizopogon vinicolor AM-OR11-026]